MAIPVQCADAECQATFERPETDAGKIVLCPRCQTQVRVPVTPDGGLTGQTLGDYKLVRRLARGGMGEIYEAMQLKLDRRVAVKVLSEELSLNPAFMQRFEREAKAAAVLNHPNVVQIYDFGKFESRPFFVMEFIEGEDLSQVTTRHSRLPLEQTLQIVEQVAIALQEAHSMGIIHRDIKPANILLTSKGKVKVSDLGLAKRIDDDVELTATGVGIGSPHFISPEQADDARRVDHRADIYSLGVTLLFLLTGRRPFDGATAFSIVLAHANKPLPSGVELGTELPANVEALIRRMAAKNPDDRYPDYVSLIADIRRVQAGGEPACGLVNEGAATSMHPTQETPGTGAVQQPVQLRIQPQTESHAHAQPQLHTYSTFTFNTETSLPPTRSNKNWRPYGIAAVAVVGVALFFVFRKSPEANTSNIPGGAPNSALAPLPVPGAGRVSGWWDLAGAPPPLRPLPRMSGNDIADGNPEEMLAAAESYAGENPDEYRNIAARFREVKIKAAGTPAARRADELTAIWIAKQQVAAENMIQILEARMRPLIAAGRHRDAMDVFSQGFPDRLRSDEIDAQILTLLARYPPPAMASGGRRGPGAAGPRRGIAPGPGGAQFPQPR